MASVDITAALITYLKTQSAITALVGSSTGARIYPDDLKQLNSNATCATVSRNAGESVAYMGGRSGLNWATMQVVGWAATRAEADALDNAICDAIGHAANVTWGTVKTTECMVVGGSRTSGAVLAQDSSDQRYYYAGSVYKVWYYDS